MSDNLDAVRQRVKGPLHEALHTLEAHIPNLPGDCHCKVIADVVLDALAPALAELEAHPPMLVDPGAEQRGYDKAVANLRDSDRFVTWAFQRRPPTALMADVCAEYLEAVKETPDV